MENSDKKGVPMPINSNANFHQFASDLLSRSRVYDVIFADNLEDRPKFRWFMTDQKGAYSFARSCKHALVVVHSCRLVGTEDSHE